jgi:hypothetical protein
MRNGTTEAPKRRGRSLAAALMGLTLLPAAAHAQFYCSAPSAPSTFSRPTKPDAPRKPFCDAMRNCQQYEVDLYNEQLRRYRRESSQYVEEAKDYIARLKRYVDDANAYAECEAKAVVADN